MNVQKIFDNLDEDQYNSALGIICAELEKQGYAIIIDGNPVKAEGFFDGDYEDLQNKLEPLTFRLIRSGDVEQEFSVEFVDFHDIIIKRKL